MPRYQLGSPLAVEPNTSNVSLKPRPHVLFVDCVQVLEAAAVRLEAVGALRELHRLAVHLAVEAGVADDAPDVVVGAVLQVRRPGVRVARAPAGAQNLPHVGLVVAVRVLEEQQVRRGRRR